MASSASTKKAARSGNPAKRATAKTWKRNVGEDLLLPSENVALVKRPGPAVLLGEGIVPDELMPIITDAVNKGKGLRPQQQKEILESANGLNMMIEMIDKVTALVVIEPKALYHKREILNEDGEGTGKWEVIPEHDRDSEEYIYTDEVDLDDKMFLFQYAVGGTRDHVRFREESQRGMGDIQALSDSK